MGKSEDWGSRPHSHKMDLQDGEGFMSYGTKDCGGGEVIKEGFYQSIWLGLNKGLPDHYRESRR